MEQGREQLLTIIVEQIGCEFEEPGMEEMLGVKGETIAGLLEWIDGSWGGVEGYMRNELGFEEDDVRIIKENLRRGQIEDGGRIKTCRWEI
jgi:hypothetical protein